MVSRPQEMSAEPEENLHHAMDCGEALQMRAWLMISEGNQ